MKELLQYFLNIKGCNFSFGDMYLKTYYDSHKEIKRNQHKVHKLYNNGVSDDFRTEINVPISNEMLSLR